LLGLAVVVMASNFWARTVAGGPWPAAEPLSRETAVEFLDWLGDEASFVVDRERDRRDSVSRKRLSCGVSRQLQHRTAL